MQVKFTVDQVYLYLAMYRVFVIGILMLVFDSSLMHRIDLWLITQ